MIKEVQLSEYIESILSTGGACHVGKRLDQFSLSPLKYIGSAEHFACPKDKIIIDGYDSEIRTIPEAVFESKNVLLLNSGLPVVNGLITGRLVRSKKFIKRVTESLPPYTKPHSRAITNIHHSLINRKKMPLLLGPIEEFNYSHWILEAVPKINLYKNAYGYPPEDIFIWGSKKKFQTESVAYFIPGSRLHYVGHGSPIVEKTAFTTSVARSVSELNPSVPDFYKSELSKANSFKYKRIYISREKAKYRKILNESNLISLLSKYAFKVIDPGDYSFADQVSIFKDAEIIVSPHGAGLTNMVFSRKLNLVLELFCSGFRDQSAYAHIARHLQAQYCAMSFAPKTSYQNKTTDPETWPGHGSFEVQCEQIKLFLDQNL